jgi:lactoylglutathione lyase
VNHDLFARREGCVELHFPPFQKSRTIGAMKIHELDHVAIHVSDVERSCAFYRGVLRLEPLPRPAFDFPGAWFRLGANQELHLIGRREPLAPVNGNNHFALRVDDIAAWETHLKQAGAEHRPKMRPDGARQIFLCDPDGHFIELFTPR